MLQLSKKDVAIRQLEEAIRMFFRRRDPVSIHTLAAAARQILADLAKHQGMVGIFDDTSYVRPEKLKEWKAFVAEPENFFKHADRDPQNILAFPENGPVFFMLDACILLGKLGKPIPKLAALFMAWVGLRYPTICTQAAHDLWINTMKTVAPDPSHFREWAEIADGF